MATSYSSGTVDLLEEIDRAEGVSAADLLSELIDTDAKFRAIVEAMAEDEAEALLYDWDFWSRPSQLLPGGDWGLWLILAGRGWGKTRTGAEAVKHWHKMGFRRFAFIARTEADYRDVMVDGESGLLSVYRRSERPDWEPSKRRVEWSNGAYALCFSSNKPNALRGPQFEKGWADEPAAWVNPVDTWDNMEMAIRLGRDPQVVATTTPRPYRWLKALIAEAETHVTRGSSYDNVSNLSPKWFRRLLSRYEGTRKGRQELRAEILEDVEGALWERAWIEQARVTAAPDLRRIVVAVDPSWGTKGDECGIVVAGIGWDGRGYVLEDGSTRATPEEWGRKVKGLYEHHVADRIVAEVNFQAEQVRLVMKTVDPRLNFKELRASRGKAIRAEPVTALYEQGKVSHVGVLQRLEDQLCEWVPGPPPPKGNGSDFSPDRLDALVWALTDLMLTSGGPAKATSPNRLGASVPSATAGARRGSSIGGAMRGNRGQGGLPR